MNKMLSVILLMLIVIGLGCSDENSATVPSKNKASENVSPTVTSLVVNSPTKESMPAPEAAKSISRKNVEEVVGDTPTPVVLLDLPPIRASDAMNVLKASWAEGYQRNTDLDVSMDLTISGSDLTQSFPLKMQGKVDKYSNFQGTLDSWDANGRQSIQLITSDPS